MGCVSSKEAALDRAAATQSASERGKEAQQGSANATLTVPSTKQPPFSEEIYRFLEVNNLSALGVLLLCSGTSEASKLREILTEIATMVTSIKASFMGRPWTLQLGALAMDCLRLVQTIPEPKLAGLTQPMERLGTAITAVHDLVRALLRPGWMHEYAKGKLSSRHCVAAHRNVIQAMLEMGLDLRMASQDHVKLAYAETMAPVMQFLMRAEDGDAVAGAVQLHQSAAAQHELADISGIPLEVVRSAVDMDDGRSSGTGTSISMSAMSDVNRNSVNIRSSMDCRRASLDRQTVNDGSCTSGALHRGSAKAHRVPVQSAAADQTAPPHAGEGSILESSTLAMDDTLLAADGWLDTSMMAPPGSCPAHPARASTAGDVAARQLRFSANPSNSTTLLDTAVAAGSGADGLLDTSMAAGGGGADGVLDGSILGGGRACDISLLDTSLQSAMRPTSFRLARVTTSSDCGKPGDNGRRSTSLPPRSAAGKGGHGPLMGVPELPEGYAPHRDALTQVLPALTCA